MSEIKGIKFQILVQVERGSTLINTVIRRRMSVLNTKVELYIRITIVANKRE